jgi:DNA-binding CsgD family transcriptional regulator
MRVADVQKLTPRQKEILRLLLNGFDAKSAARELGISVHTVTEHLREARRHLGVSSSREAARILWQVESRPPENMGPSTLGVVGPTRARLSLGKLSPNGRLAYAGVSVVILIAGAIAFSLAGGNALSERSKAPSGPVSSPSTPEANPSPYQSRDVAVGTFDRLKVSGPFKVAVFVSGEPTRVQLQGPPALLADTVVAVEGGTLTIRFREGATWSWNPGSGVNVVVSARSLDAVNLEGAADVEVYGVHGETFTVTTEGSGAVKASGLDVGRVQLATGGSGGISVEGSARQATYVVGGSGSIDAMRLRVRNASIAIGGAGSTYANVSGTANISLSGNGRVEVVGGATCIKQPAKSRRIECR